MFLFRPKPIYIWLLDPRLAIYLPQSVHQFLPGYLLIPQMEKFEYKKLYLFVCTKRSFFAGEQN